MVTVQRPSVVEPTEGDFAEMEIVVVPSSVTNSKMKSHGLVPISSELFFVKVSVYLFMDYKCFQCPLIKCVFHCGVSVA